MFTKTWGKIESDCHVHLYPGVWVVVMENEIGTCQCQSLVSSVPDVGMASEPTGAGGEWGNDTLPLLITPFRVHILKAH